MFESLAVPFLLSALLLPWVHAADPIAVTVPPAPTDGRTVKSNFFGISVELSFMDQYFGNDTSSIPSTMINYLSQIRQRTGSNPLRLRIGGNSADVSNYVEGQTSPMVQLTDPKANANNQPVNYGPVLWDVMAEVGERSGGIDYLIGLSLNDSEKRGPIIAGAAKKALGSSLDAMLLGNEPDLYAIHKQRPKLANYTVQDYFGEFDAVHTSLQNTPAGNLVTDASVAGPTICCSWDAETLFKEGYISRFGNALKYITLQHYPQNNCFGKHAYDVPYYTLHSNAVTLAAWQKPGIDLLLASGAQTKAQLVMSEFNSASCGGVPNVSDTFAVGSLWSTDYALQMSSIGYSAAYIHTREAGISYNLVVPSADGNGPWVTNPPFYSLLAVAEILQSDKGVKVVDLDIAGSKTAKDSQVAGYAVYDGQTSAVTRVALFNFGASSSQFTIPSTVVPKDAKVQVKYLSASDLDEETNIAWGGQTFVGAGDGKPVAAPKDAVWALPNVDLDCSKECRVDVRGPSLAVVFFNTASNNNQGDGSNNGSADSKDSKNNNNDNGALTPNKSTWLWCSSVLASLAAGLIWVS